MSSARYWSSNMRKKEKSTVCNDPCIFSVKYSLHPNSATRIIRS